MANYEAAQDRVKRNYATISNASYDDLVSAMHYYTMIDDKFSKLKTSREKLQYLLDNPKAFDDVSKVAFKYEGKRNEAQESGNESEVFSNEADYNKYAVDLKDQIAKKRNSLENDADNYVQTAKDNTGMSTLSNSEYLDYVNKGVLPKRYQTERARDLIGYASLDNNRINPKDTVDLTRNSLSPEDIMKNRLSNESYAHEHPFLNAVSKGGEWLGETLNVPYLNDLAKAREEGTLRRQDGELMNPINSKRLVASEATDIPLAAMNLLGGASLGKSGLAKVANSKPNEVIGAFSKEVGGGVNGSLGKIDLNLEQTPSLLSKVVRYADPSTGIGARNQAVETLANTGKNSIYGALPQVKKDVLQEDNKRGNEIVDNALSSGLSSALLGYGLRRVSKSDSKLTEDMQDYVNKKLNLSKVEALDELASLPSGSGFKSDTPKLDYYLKILNAKRKQEGLDPVTKSDVFTDLTFSNHLGDVSNYASNGQGFLEGKDFKANPELEIRPSEKSFSLSNEQVVPGYEHTISDDLLSGIGANRKNVYVGERGQMNPDLGATSPRVSELFGNDSRKIPLILNTYKDVPESIRGFGGYPSNELSSAYIFGKRLDKGATSYEAPNLIKKNGYPISTKEEARDYLESKGIVNPSDNDLEQVIYESNIPFDRQSKVRELGKDYIDTNAAESDVGDLSIQERYDAAKKKANSLPNSLASASFLIGKGYQPKEQEDELPESEQNTLSSIYDFKYSPDLLRRMIKPDYIRIKESEQ